MAPNDKVKSFIFTDEKRKTESSHLQKYSVYNSIIIIDISWGTIKSFQTH